MLCCAVMLPCCAASMLYCAHEGAEILLELALQHAHYLMPRWTLQRPSAERYYGDTMEILRRYYGDTTEILWSLKCWEVLPMIQGFMLDTSTTLNSEHLNCCASWEMLPCDDEDEEDEP
jgi:hypothetical protein